MKAINIIKSNGLLESHIRKSNTLCESVVKGMTAEQKAIVEGIVAELRPLIEVTLTQQQIDQLFAGAEKAAQASGNNRTGMGKAVDVAKLPVEAAKKANDIINNVGKWLQDTKPVQAMDQKFEQLKNQINTKFPDSKLLDGISNLGMWMKENPGKSAAIIGVLTAIASLAAGPIGGAVAGQVLRGASSLMQGEKLSTAIGKGIKTAALGYISGKAFEMLGNWIAGFREQAMAFGPEDAGLERISWSATKTLRSFGTEMKETTQGFDCLVYKADADAIRSAMETIKSGQPGGFDQLREIGKMINAKEYTAGLQAAVDDAWKLAKDNDSLLQFINDVKTVAQTASQGAVAAAGTKQDLAPTQQNAGKINTAPAINENIDKQLTIRHWALNESLNRARGGFALTDKGIKFVFESAVNEGPMDLLKKGAAAVGNKVATVGKNLTNKVTVDKLQSAWKKAGSPTDSEEIAKILASAGVEQSIIANVYKQAGIPAPAQTSAQPAGNTDELGRTEPTLDAPGQMPTVKTDTPTQSSDATTQNSPAQEPQQAQQPQAQQAQQAQEPQAEPQAQAQAPSQPATAPAQPATPKVDAKAKSFVDQLVASYNALSAADKAEIAKELETAISMNDNPNVVRSKTESKKSGKKAI